MNEKIQNRIDECIQNFPNSTKDIFNELSEYAVSLGYTPKWVKVRVNGKSVNGNSLAFSKSKVKRTLIKISPSNNPHEHEMPCLYLIFFASSGYSEIFNKGVKRVIEEFDGRYTG